MKTLNELSHLSCKQKGHGVFLNYLYDLKAQIMGR